MTPREAAALCGAGVALGDIRRGFTWQAWQLATATFVLRGRRATCGTGLALVTRLDPRRPLAWQVCHLVTSAGLALVQRLVPRDAAALCVAGVALGDIRRRFTWQVWRLGTSTFVSHGRRGTYGT